jgi:hypothetical protein
MSPPFCASRGSQLMHRSLALVPARPIAAPSPLARVKLLTAKLSLEFLGIGRIGKTVNVEPLAFIVHGVASGAERKIFAEVMNLVVAIKAALFEPIENVQGRFVERERHLVSRKSAHAGIQNEPRTRVNGARARRPGR